jgi:hypothetical protein
VCGVGAGAAAASSAGTVAKAGATPTPTRIDLLRVLGPAGASARGPLPAAAAAAHALALAPPAFRLLSSCAQWGAAVPVRRFSYLDVGARPFDAANAAFTFEAWVLVGSAAPAAAASSSSGSAADEDGGGSGGGGGARAAPSPRPAGEFVVVRRTERAFDRAGAGGARPALRARTQWQLSVLADGSLRFAAFTDAPAGDGATDAGGEGGGGGGGGDAGHARTLPSQNHVTSAAGAVALGEVSPPMARR